MSTTFDGWKERTIAATVHLPGRGGLGVLVPGGFVLTAAHCIEWSTSGELTLENNHLETVKPKNGPSFRLRVCAVEPVSDLAALEEPEEVDDLFDDIDAFRAFCKATTPVPLAVDGFPLSLAERMEQARTRKEPARNPPAVRVHVLSHRETWMEANAVGPRGNDPCDRIELTEKIENGTSGGPVVNEAGQLVGLVSWSTERIDGGVSAVVHGRLPRPYRGLPVWLWRLIEAAQQRMPSTP